MMRGGTAQARPRCTGPAPIVFALTLSGLAACSSGGRVDNVVKDPDTPSRLHVAEVAQGLGQNDIALSMFRAAAEADPSSVQAQSRYAGALAQAGQLPVAEQVIARAIRRRPDDPVLTVALGRLKVQAGHPGEALVLFDKVLARDPTNVGAQIGRGVALDLSGQSEEAQRSYRAAQAADPLNVAATNDLGLSLLLVGRVDEARAMLGALAQRPNAPIRVVNNLGIAQAIAGDRATAMTTLAGRMGTQDLDAVQSGFGVPPTRTGGGTSAPRPANRSGQGRD